jgi:hypothetical protein
MDKVNPEITNILKGDKNTVQLFKRILNETLRKRKPYVRNAYTVVGGKRRQWR